MSTLPAESQVGRRCRKARPAPPVGSWADGWLLTTESGLQPAKEKPRSGGAFLLAESPETRHGQRWGWSQASKHLASFMPIKLAKCYPRTMSKTEQRRGRGRSPHSVATRVHDRVRQGGERYWSLSDFIDLPATAVAHALSRLAGAGELQRVRKGLYYRSKPTVLGLSLIHI